MTGTALGDGWRREVLLARLRALGDDGRLLLLAYMAGSFPATLEVALTRFEGDPEKGRDEGHDRGTSLRGSCIEARQERIDRILDEELPRYADALKRLGEFPEPRVTKEDE